MGRLDQRLQIHVSNQQHDLPISAPQVRALVKELLKLEKCRCHEVSIHFVDIKTISVLHEQYFNDPSPTDCISFPIDPPEETTYRVLGDVFVCPLAAQEFAFKNKGDPYTETSLYVVHGILHLIGYDDIDDKCEPLMRSTQEALMNQLKAKKLLLTKC